jgi:hypothetical protein
MDIHENARLTPHGGERLAKMIISGQTSQAASEAAAEIDHAPTLQVGSMALIAGDSGAPSRPATERSSLLGHLTAAAALA